VRRTRKSTLTFLQKARRIIGTLLTLGITLGAAAVAIIGLAVLMNNVAINEQPGIRARIYRFLTVNWAATSAKGTSLAVCQHDGAGGIVTAQKPTPTPTPSPGAEAGAEQEEVYPEVVRRGYPGLSRAALFKMTKETVSTLGGWRIVKENPRAYTLECVYTTRIFGFEDEVKIVVTPRSEIDLCSHSGLGHGRIPGWLFSGDFAANIGHIKEFYSAIEPMVDRAYKEEERKQGGGFR
jgi:hypothetical protein